MSYNYQKSISGDFPDAIVSPSLLKYQIDNEASITTSLEKIDTAGDDCNIWFVSEPSSGEKTAIDALIAAHTSAAIDNWDRGCKCCGPPIMTTSERDAITGPINAGSMIWNSTVRRYQGYNNSEWSDVDSLEVLDLDFTGTDYDTKAECNAVGIKFSDADMPYPTTTYVQHAGTWTHVTSEGWKPATTDETKGPSLIIPLSKCGDWEFEITFDYSSADVSDTGQLILFAMTPSNHIAFFALVDDSSAVANQLVTSLWINNGNDTYSSVYTGQILAGTGQRIIKLRNLNGTYGVYDDEDDAWHDYAGRQSSGISFAPSILGIQGRKGTNTMVTFEIENLKITYL